MKAATSKPNTGKSRTTTPKRDLFAELNEGMTALAEARQGKRKLKTHTIPFKAVLT